MEIESHRNIGAAFLAISDAHPDREVYGQAQIEAGHVGNPLKDAPRHWRSTTYREVRSRIARITHHLCHINMAIGERVAILSGTRPEWMEADIGILCGGGVSVSVYPSLTAHEIGYILFDSGAQIVFAENEEQVAKLLSLIDRSFPIPGTEERPAGEGRIHLRAIITFEQTTRHPLVVPLAELAAPPREPFERTKTIQPADCAALVYTSGTTGAPKGVVQTHANHLANVRQAFNARMYDDASVLMLILPLAHSFAKLMGYIGFLTTATIRFAAVPDPTSSKFDPRSISKDIAEANAEIIPVVPRLLEKMNAGIMEKANAGGIRGLLLRSAISSALARSAAQHGRGACSIKNRILNLLTSGVRRKIKEKLFGPRFRYAVSGGAKLSVDVAQFFDALGIEILEGYGLTETCVATNVNRCGKKRIGSVGPVLDSDIEVRVSNDGEILFRGPNVAQGYYQRPTATHQSWDSEGWFHTGDLGRLDSEGYLWIEGRKKELIITAGGKKIPPDPIEQRIKGCEVISQAMLVGEGKPFCAALISLNDTLVRQWGTSRGLALNEELHTDQQVYDLVWQHIEKINADLASYESIKKIAILPHDLTQENGLLTPTFKVRRKEVEKRFLGVIEELYHSKSTGVRS